MRKNKKLITVLKSTFNKTKINTRLKNAGVSLARDRKCLINLVKTVIGQEFDDKIYEAYVNFRDGKTVDNEMSADNVARKAGSTSKGNKSDKSRFLQNDRINFFHRTSPQKILLHFYIVNII